MKKNLDEPQAATPLPTIPDKRLVQALEDGARSSPARPVETSPEQEFNEKAASEELALIFELHDSRAFQWFQRECLDNRYRAAEGLLKDPHAKESIEIIRARFFAVREIYIWLLEREIAHRETANSDDAEIVRLREKLALL